MSFMMRVLRCEESHSPGEGGVDTGQGKPPQDQGRKLEGDPDGPPMLVTGDTASPGGGDTDSSKDCDGEPGGPSTQVGLSEARSSCDSEDDELVDGIEDLSTTNAEFRPFRDEASRQHTNYHEEQQRRRTTSVTSTASSATADPRLVKTKVKRQLQKQQQLKFARRVRKSGEAAITTKSRRVNREAIKETAVWDY